MSGALMRTLMGGAPAMRIHDDGRGWFGGSNEGRNRGISTRDRAAERQAQPLPWSES